MNIWMMYVLFAAGIVLVVRCADAFVDGAAWLAEATGMPAFLVGATVVSFGTTLPELLVSSIAAHNARTLLRRGLTARAAEQVGMAIGNGIGSVIANTALVLAVSILFMPVAVQMSAFVKKAVLLICSVAALWCVTAGTGALLPWGAGVLLLLFIFFMWENIACAKQEAGKDAAPPIRDGGTVTKHLAVMLFGIAGVTLGSHLLVRYGSAIAVSLGVSDAVIGITAVAIGTSLPELVTSLTAILKKQPSLSVGNVIGANVIDIVLLLPVSSLLYGGALPVTQQNRVLDFPFCMLVTLTALVPVFFQKRFLRWQGVALLLLYVAYLAVVCMSANGI